MKILKNRTKPGTTLIETVLNGDPCSSKKVYGREGSKNGGKLVTLFMEGTWYDLIKNNLAMYIVVMKAQGQFSVVCPEMFYLFPFL